MKLSLLRLLVPIFGALLLTACGGGTGDSTPAAAATDGAATDGTTTGGTTTGGTTTVGEASSIMFVSATPENITLKGSAKPGGTETSILEFLVTDDKGIFKPNQVVSFSLSNSSAGLGGLSLSVNSATTDADGKARTVVTAGTVQTTVAVTASVTLTGGEVRSATSGQLVISLGLPHAASFSLSLLEHNPDRWFEQDGTKNTATVHMSDRYGVAVEGSRVIFIAETGAQFNSPGYCVTNVTGGCSLDFVSSGDRPADGRISIMAYTDGEETFTDGNGNGLFDAGEFFPEVSAGVARYDLGEAFLATTQTGRTGSNPSPAFISTTDILIDYDGDAQYSAANGLFNGLLCSAAAEAAGHCPAFLDNSGPALVHLHRTTVMSSAPSKVSDVTIFPAGPFDLASSFELSATVGHAGLRLPPTAGTTIVFSTTAGELEGETSFTVPTDLNEGQFTTPTSVTLKSAKPAELTEGMLTVTVTSASGEVVVSKVAVTDPAAP